ncbi:hypothetical protein BH10PLA2_BH10PLA2_08340 [soil metagenome]
MLNVGIIKNASGALKYFTPEGHDYWVEDHSTEASFGGKLADKLGLGEFDINQLHALLLGIDPRTMKVVNGQLTGEQLTPGTKENKRAGFEVTLDGPKDLGVLMALGADRRIITDVLERAKDDVMGLIERDAKTRVRTQGDDYDRDTGNIAYASVLHLTARPESGKIDFQPHYHVLVANGTYDPVEKRMKALQLQPFALNGAKDARPYYMAYFNSKLAQYMQEAGYGVEKNGDTFRVTGVPDRVRKEFSQRTNRIEKVAAELEKRKQEYLNDPNAKLSKKAKAKLAMTTRVGKEPGRSWESLMAHWTGRVSPDDLADIHLTVAEAKQPRPIEHANAASLDWAIRHLSERKSVFSEREVITNALKHGVTSATPEGIYRELGKRKDLIRRDIKGRSMISTQGVLGEERAIVAFAQKNRGNLAPLAELSTGRSLANQKAKASGLGVTPAPDLSALSLSQREAVKHVWGSRDSITIVEGLAGVGKTTMLKPLLKGINKPWFAVATSSDASRINLRKDPFFRDANTLAAFFNQPELQERIRNGLLVVDENSMTGAKDFRQLTDLAQQYQFRILVVGDRQQHRSIARGDVMNMLVQKAGLPVAVVDEIQRQKGDYLNAVEKLAKGKVDQGFAKLDSMGWIKEGGLVDDYIAAVKAGKECLVVSPTHANGDILSNAIRERMKAEGMLKGEDHEFEALRNLNLTQAELEQAKKEKPEGVIVQRYGAFRPDVVHFAVGDRVRITAGGKDMDGRRLDNGMVFTVTGFDSKGNVQVQNDESKMQRTIGKDFKHWRPGYLETSFGAQGKTVDSVFISMPETTFPAIDMRTAYVTVSRGRHEARVYSDAKEELRELWRRDEDRLLASDLVRKPRHHIRKRMKRFMCFLRDAASRSMDYVKPEKEMGHAR